jgi:hypothetical protein
MQQLSLSFEPGLAQRSRCLRDHMTTRVYGSSYGGLVAVAGKLDMAPSKLTEKMLGVDSSGKPRGMTLDEFERYIEKTGDLSPVYYLVDKFLRDPNATRHEALDKIAGFIEQFPALIAAAGLDKPAKAGRR